MCYLVGCVKRISFAPAESIAKIGQGSRREEGRHRACPVQGELWRYNGHGGVCTVLSQSSACFVSMPRCDIRCNMVSTNYIIHGVSEILDRSMSFHARTSSSRTPSISSRDNGTLNVSAPVASMREVTI